jgi:hypothetical protein
VNKKGVRRKNIIELYGSGKAKCDAIRKFHSGFIPREPYTVMNAEDLSEDDVERGEWLDIEVES